MPEGFQIADYVLCGVTLALAVTGLFRGFSGTLAFLLASAAAACVASFGWVHLAGLTEATWMCVAGTLIATLLAFGLVRFVVTKLVHGLLAQPADAIFGFVAGAFVGALLVALWAYSGFHTEQSLLVREMQPYVR